MLSTTIKSKLQISIDPLLVRLGTRADDCYFWTFLPAGPRLLGKNLGASGGVTIFFRLRQERYDFHFQRMGEHEANSSANAFFLLDQQQISRQEYKVRDKHSNLNYACLAMII